LPRAIQGAGWCHMGWPGTTGRARDTKMAELKTEISDLGRLTDRLDKINRSMRQEDRTSQ
jgi:hypothetical protein